VPPLSVRVDAVEVDGEFVAVVDLCRVSVHQAKRLLGKLVEERSLVRAGVGKATRYE
jgi:hypothetical protein